MTDRNGQPPQQPSPFAPPWPEGVIARYLTVAGAHVDLTGSGTHVYARCTGCPFGHAPGAWWHEDRAHDLAQGHAEKCRALPRPAAGR